MQEIHEGSHPENDTSASVAIKTRSDVAPVNRKGEHARRAAAEVLWRNLRENGTANTAGMQIHIRRSLVQSALVLRL